jgi:hypothetical protein
MVTKKSSVSSEKPITKAVGKPAKKLTIKEMESEIENHYLKLENKKQFSLTDANSISDFHNLHRDAEQHKSALKEWHKYLES